MSTTNSSGPAIRLDRRVERSVGPDWQEQESEFDEAWLEAQLDSEWTVCFRLAIEDNRPSVIELRVIPSQDRWTDEEVTYEPGEWSVQYEGHQAAIPAGGLKSKHVRQVHFHALDSLPDIVRWVQDRQPRSLDALSMVGLTPLVKTKKPGPEGMDDAELAELASEYTVLAAKGFNPHPVIARRHSYSQDTSRDWIKKARKRGLLSGASPGRAGGHLTQYALDLIHEAHLSRES